MQISTTPRAPCSILQGPELLRCSDYSKTVSHHSPLLTPHQVQWSSKDCNTVIIIKLSLQIPQNHKNHRAFIQSYYHGTWNSFQKNEREEIALGSIYAYNIGIILERSKSNTGK